jgi:hypothetical protein
MTLGLKLTFGLEMTLRLPSNDSRDRGKDREARRNVAPPGGKGYPMGIFASRFPGDFMRLARDTPHRLC